MIFVTHGEMRKKKTWSIRLINNSNNNNKNTRRQQRHLLTTVEGSHLQMQQHPIKQIDGVLTVGIGPYRLSTHSTRTSACHLRALTLISRISEVSRELFSLVFFFGASIARLEAYIFERVYRKCKPYVSDTCILSDENLRRKKYWTLTCTLGRSGVNLVNVLHG